MKQLKLLLVALLLTYVSYAQSRIKPFEIHYRDQSTNWEFMSLGGDETPYLTFYFNHETDARRKLVRITISNGWNDSFTIIANGAFTREGAGIKWRAADRASSNCTLEMIARTENTFNYTQLYIRYVNIEYVYSFKIQ